MTTEDPIFENRSALILELKQLIIDNLELTDVAPDDIGDDDSLFDSGLELDSIDALELVVGLEERYKIKIASSEESRSALQSVNSLADFIMEKWNAGHSQSRNE